MGIVSQDCCQPDGGLFCSNWIWIIVLILFCCGGLGGRHGCWDNSCGCGNDGFLGGNLLGNNFIWILLIILFCSCSGRRPL